jgi:hypothetical protein
MSWPIGPPAASHRTWGGTINRRTQHAKDLISDVLSGDDGVRRPRPRTDTARARHQLQAAGYSQVGEGKSTAEGIAVTAMKDGKEVHLVVDSSGQIKERGK